MKLDVYMASFNQRTLDSDETVSVELFINILGSISWKISNNVDDLRLWFSSKIGYDGSVLLAVTF